MSQEEKESIFAKIIRKEIPADIVYEDDFCLCFRDIHPVAPTHLLLIPKVCIPKLSDAVVADKDILGELMLKVSVITKELGINDAFRVVINNGAGACQTVFHLHLHIIADRALNWPPG